jgi:hypothetical protein
LLADLISRSTRGTGYWLTTDREHSNYNHFAALATEEEEQPLASTSAYTLEVQTQGLSTLGTDPLISPFVTARSTDSGSDSDSTEAPPPNEEDPSPEQEHPEDPVLTAQLQY